MQTFKIVYFEGQFSRTLHTNKALQIGANSFRPWGFRTEATFPITPRPGDRLFFKLEACAAKYFPECDPEDGRPSIVAEVKFVELEDGIDAITVHCTDPGCEAYGKMSEADKREHEACVGQPINWK